MQPLHYGYASPPSYGGSSQPGSPYMVYSPGSMPGMQPGGPAMGGLYSPGSLPSGMPTNGSFYSVPGGEDYGSLTERGAMLDLLSGECGAGRPAALALVEAQAAALGACAARQCCAQLPPLLNPHPHPPSHPHH